MHDVKQLLQFMLCICFLPHFKHGIRTHSTYIHTWNSDIQGDILTS